MIDPIGLLPNGDVIAPLPWSATTKVCHWLDRMPRVCGNTAAYVLRHTDGEETVLCLIHALRVRQRVEEAAQVREVREVTHFPSVQTDDEEPT